MTASTGRVPAFRTAILALLLASSVDAVWQMPAPDRRKLADEAERIKALPEQDREWLTELVAPIILAKEREVFLELPEPYLRGQFKEKFWERRELPGQTPPLGPGYRYRYRDLRRLADEKYDGWKNDAGKMVIYHGEPADLFEVRGCQETYRPLEVWTYTNLRGDGGRSRYIFYSSGPKAPRRLWNITVRNQDVFAPGSCRRSFDSLYLDCVMGPEDRCARCPDHCPVYQAYLEIRARQASLAGAGLDYARLFRQPEISTEGLEEMSKDWAGASGPGAGRIRIEGPSSAAGSATPRISPPSTPTPAPTPRKLSRQEIQERILRLERKYRDWLEIAAPLLSEPELMRFLQLSDNEKDEFMREFWKRRS